MPRPEPDPRSPAAILATLTVLSGVPVLLTWRFGPQSGMEAMVILFPWFAMCVAHGLLGPLAIWRAWAEGRRSLALGMGAYLLAFAGVHLVYWALAAEIPERLEERYVERHRPADHALGELSSRSTDPETLDRRAAELVAEGADPDRRLPRGGTPLSRAAASDLALTRALLAAGADPDQRTASGVAPLHAAIRNGEYEIAHLLLEYGADPDLEDPNGSRPLCRVLSTGGPGALAPARLRLVEALLRAEADPNLCDAFGMAAGYRQREALRRMLALGPPNRAASERLTGVLTQAIRNKEHDWAELLIEAGADATPGLALAVERRDERAVRILLEGGADARSRPYLIQTAGSRSADAVTTLLLTHGADPRARDDKGRTPLIQAVRSAHDENVRRLVAAGADPDSRYRDGPIVVSLQTMIPKQKHVTALLLELGADPDARGVEGDTALMRATRNSHHALIAALIAAGADLALGDDEGRTALHHAASTRFEVATSIDLLVDAGAPLEAVDAAGATPLCVAQREGNRAGAERLQERGARDPGCTPEQRVVPIRLPRSLRPG
ncbi:MAG: ankyrin repeat domain-containing protein [Myxococcota bacterium]|nr:ankyrin repeat domain-containing protein [Myxococcota bacterium]